MKLNKNILVALLIMSSCCAKVTIVTESQFPVTITYRIDQQDAAQTMHLIPGSKGTIFADCAIVDKVSLWENQQYGAEKPEQVSCISGTFTIPKTFDSALIHQIYEANDLSALEYLLKNGLDPLAPLTKEVTMQIQGQTLVASAIMMPAMRLRGAPSGTGMQRYNQLLDAAVFDGKADMVNLIKAGSTKQA